MNNSFSLNDLIGLINNTDVFPKVSDNNNIEEPNHFLISFSDANDFATKISSILNVNIVDNSLNKCKAMSFLALTLIYDNITICIASNLLKNNNVVKNKMDNKALLDVVEDFSLIFKESSLGL